MDNIINDFIDNGFLDFYLDEKQKNFFREIVKNINKCKLYKTRQNIVFGVGKKDARLMFIGEGPGADEDRLRRTICR